MINLCVNNLLLCEVLDFTMQDITCRGLRAGNPARILHGHNKPCSGCIAISCIRSGAFSPNGIVDLAKGERSVVKLG